VLKRSITYKRPWYKLILENPKDLEVIRELVDKLDVIDNASIIEYLKNHTVLGKYNLDAPSKEVGIDKLYLHPSKIANLINANGYDMSYPISVEMTLTNTCNLRCVYCSDNELRLRQGLNQDIDLEVIKNLFDDLAGGGTTGITLEGGGEPSLYSKFSEVVFYAKSKGLALGLITNGTVRISEDLLKEFEWIRVSLDASTAEEYVDLKGVDCFEKVLSNIAHYSKYCNTVGIGYVVTNKNISQIEALVMRLRELGVSYIQLRPVVDCPELYPEGVDLSYLMVYQNSTFGVIIDGMKENAESGNFNLPCVANGITSVISGNGNVYICGRLNIYDWLKPIGNINEQSFHDIWNGMERKKQLEMVNDKIFCTANCPQCRVSKFNRLVDRLNNIKSKDFI
jgi:radical SAM protein with 4Fe4S-binding SPASM domain